jgi:4-amino-4-deoxy-L-arabinose transferase-like glycosyltransferase
MNGKKIPKNYVFFVFIIALCLRLVWVYFHSMPPIRIDAAEHDILAKNIADGYGYCYYPGHPTSYRPPLYPIFLSIIYIIFGHNYTWVHILEALIGSLTCILVYIISFRYFDERVAKISSLITALYPTYITLTTGLMTENLFTFLVALFIYSVYLYRSRHRGIYIIFAGIVLALSTLCRATMLPIIFLLPVCSAYSDEKPDRGFKEGLWVSVIALMVMSPWIIRNYSVHHAIVLVDTHGGATFHYHHNMITPDGYYWKAVQGDIQAKIAKEIDSETQRVLAGESPIKVFLDKAANGPLVGLRAIDPARADALAKLSEVDRNKEFYKEGIQAIMTYPTTYAKHFIREIIKFWHIFDDDGKYIPVYSFLLPFYLFGVFITLGNSRKYCLLNILVFTIWIICAVINNGARFRAPFEIIMIMIALYAIYWLHDNLMSRKLLYFVLISDTVITIIIFLSQTRMRFWIKSIFGGLGFDVMPY